jgi:hypothetical protein
VEHEGKGHHGGRHRAPPFVQPGAGTPVSVDGIALTLLPVSDPVASAAKAVSTSNLGVDASAYAVPLDALEQRLGDEAALRRFAYYLLVRPFGTYDQAEAQLTMIGRSDGAAVIEHALAQYNQLTPEQQSAFFGNARLLAAALAGRAGFTLFRVHWDNADDTNADGLMGINPTRGEVRLVSCYDYP